jgi:hypothetical protein
VKDVPLVVCCSEEAASLRSELDQAVAAIKAMDDELAAKRDAVVRLEGDAARDQVR